MRKIIFLLTTMLFSASVFSQGNQVVVANASDGMKLKVDGKDFMVNGMNWDYFPIGTNYTYSLWKQPDAFIQQALDDEMGLLKNMGVNTIRVYAGMPIGQLIYFMVQGDVQNYYNKKSSAKYNDKTSIPVESMMFKNKF